MREFFFKRKNFFVQYLNYSKGNIQIKNESKKVCVNNMIQNWSKQPLSGSATTESSTRCMQIFNELWIMVFYIKYQRNNMIKISHNNNNYNNKYIWVWGIHKKFWDDKKSFKNKKAGKIFYFLMNGRKKMSLFYFFPIAAVFGLFVQN